MLPAEVVRQIRRLQLRARRAVEDLLGGEYHSVFKGTGLSFEEVREYQPGDDVRSIDWNVTARVGQPFVKRYVEERERTLLLLIDVSGSQSFGTRQQPKRAVAAELAALLGFCAIHNNDRVGLVTFTDEVELYVPPSKGTRHALRLIREILFHQPARTGTRLASALDFIQKVQRKRAIVFLMSDFLDTGYERSLRLAARKHDLTVVRVDDPLENELPRVGLLQVQDAETGRQWLIDTSHRPARELYQARARERREALAKLARGAALDLIEVSTGGDHLDALVRFSSVANAGDGDPDVTALFLALVLTAAPAEEVRVGETVCRLTTDAAAVPLSGEVHLTLSVEGRAPVDVDVPRPLTQSPDWQIHPGPSKVTPLSDGRERWEKSFRLVPFTTGDAVPLPVQPLTYRTGHEVTDRTMTWKPLAVRVTTTVTGTDLTQARPATGIEELPPLPSSTFPWALVTGGVVVGALVVVGLFVGLRRRTEGPPRRLPREVALDDLRRLGDASGFGPPEVERLADIVRRFFEYQLALAATKQTSVEFVAAVRQSGALPDERVRDLEDLLRRCDLVKFAGLRPTPQEGESLLTAATRLITDQAPPSGP